MPIPLLTPRLILQRLQVEDADSLFAYRSHPDVMRYQLWHPVSVQEARAFIENQLAEQPNLPGMWYQMGIWLISKNTLIGDCGCQFPAGKAEEMELGITLAPQYQGCGYATEAVQSVMQYAFQELEKQKIFGLVDTRNSRSIALLTRLGMRCVATLPRNTFANHEWCDDLLFEITAQQWHTLYWSSQIS